MQLPKDEIIQKNAKQKNTKCVTLSYHTNANGLVLFEDTTSQNDKMILQKFNKKKIFINRLNYAQHKLVCNCIDVY